MGDELYGLLGGVSENQMSRRKVPLQMFGHDMVARHGNGQTSKIGHRRQKWSFVSRDDYNRK